VNIKKKTTTNDASQLYVESNNLWLVEEHGFNFFGFKTYFQSIFNSKYHDKFIHELEK
jgi:hypothetical protein